MLIRGAWEQQIRWQNDATTAPAALTAYGASTGARSCSACSHNLAGPMTVGLYVGSVNTQVQLVPLGTVDPAQVNTLAARIPATAGPNGDF